ncbi:MAG: hypothetical protein HYS44_00515, partial [Candidatus Niyogibacteria bacterium]|nr:hypothetical protein [Candidatus Niyogibacteria bacterium]
MKSKTPQFDAALDAYYSKLELDEKGGQTRTCRISGKSFYIRSEDIGFYKSIRVPLPTVSPDERHRQKFAFTNIYNLFKLKSAHSGKIIVAMYPPTTPYKIYEHAFWFGDQWDPMDYGRFVDADAPFFDQFKKLTLDVPRINLFIDPASVNTEYANVVLRVKNCYLVFDSVDAEDCWNGAGFIHTKNSGNCAGLFYGDTCYGLLDCKNMYRSFWCEQSQDCQNSYFLYDCRDCDSCFGSVNLRHKKHYFLNEPLSKEAYAARIKELDFGSRDVVERYKKQFEELKQKAIHRPNHNENTTNSVGDRLMNSTNCYQSSFMDGAQNVAYSMGGLNNRDSYHGFGGINVERGYENLTSLDTYGSKFCYFDKEGRGLEYSWECAGCEDCFGCVALSKKKFCIFNKQYTEDEYWPLVDAIKTAMLERGEYGEFYPPHLSPFPYNIS